MTLYHIHDTSIDTISELFIKCINDDKNLHMNPKGKDDTNPQELIQTSDQVTVLPKVVDETAPVYPARINLIKIWAPPLAHEPAS